VIAVLKGRNREHVTLLAISSASRALPWIRRTRCDRQALIGDRRSRLAEDRGARRLDGMEIIDIQMNSRGALDDAIARAVAIGGLVSIALIHVLQLPVAFAAIGYLGVVFIAAAAACLVLAAVLTRTSDDSAWIAAGGLAGLILLCYVLSRTVGLPGFTEDIGEWSEAPGLASMVVETLLVFLTAAVFVSRRQPMRGAGTAHAA
jgi:hypothetical protein